MNLKILDKANKKMIEFMLLPIWINEYARESSESRSYSCPNGDIIAASESYT